ncbi:MAG: O-antigen ligase family protein [Bacteroidia bacterium]|nr:O-antigen ligase family protein [Bacteroidia bacterium]
MLKALPTNRGLIILYALALLLGAASCWASLNGFDYLFLLPIGLAILLYGLFRTEKFILLAGAIAPLSININDIGSGFGLAVPTEPLIIFIFGMLVFRFFMQLRIEKEILLHPLTISIIVYLCWFWFSSIFSSMPIVSLKFSLARTWYIVVFYIALISIFKKFNSIHFFLKSFTIFTLILVIFTLIKHAAEGFVRSSSYSVSWPFFPDHGMYAAAIAFCVPVLAFYAFNGRILGHNWAWLPIAGVFFVVLLFGVVVSYTRATWLSLIAAFGVYVMLRFKIKFVWMLGGLALISIFAILKQEDILYSLEANKQGSSDEIEGHVKSVSNITTDPSNLERINRWKCASRMVQQRPITGFGPGTFVFQYGVFQKSSELTIISTNSGDLGDAHSEYFSSLSELGIPGFVFWISLVLISISTAFKVVYNTTSSKVKVTAMIALLGLITYYFHGLLNNYSQYDKIAVPMWGFMAIIVALDVFYLQKEVKINAPKT